MSILMNDQVFHNKKWFFSLSLSCYVAANKEHICMTKNFNFFLIFKFQSKHSHEYSDVLFHVFADCLMPAPRGAAPEHNMREALILFIKENRDKVTTIAAPFLKKKKLSLDKYIAFMSTPGNWGDELALHLLAIMSQIHYCVITKTKIYDSYPDTFHSPSVVHTALVYLGNSIFLDTMTLAKNAHLHPILTCVNRFQVT